MTATYIKTSLAVSKENTGVICFTRLFMRKCLNWLLIETDINWLQTKSPPSSLHTESSVGWLLTDLINWLLTESCPN